MKRIFIALALLIMLTKLSVKEVEAAANDLGV